MRKKFQPALPIVFATINNLQSTVLHIFQLYLFAFSLLSLCLITAGMGLSR